MARRKRQALLTTLLTMLTAFLILIFVIVGALGTATAEPKTEPKKNQIVVPASCTTDGQSFTTTFVINGMAKTGLLTDSTGNIVITSYTVSYYDDRHNLLGTDTFDSGIQLNSQDDIVSCSGKVDTTLQGLGDVTAVYEFQGFLTPTR
jgi:hypothetical protein